MKCKEKKEKKRRSGMTVNKVSRVYEVGMPGRLEKDEKRREIRGRKRIKRKEWKGR